MQRSLMSVLAYAFVSGVGIASAQSPVPEFYGIYALEDGTLTELYEDPDLNTFGAAVRFVVFSRGSGMPVRKMFFLPPAQPEDSRSNEFTGWDDFGKQVQAFSEASALALSYGVPATAVEVAFRVGPYGDNNEMVRVVPRQTLGPGLYQLMKGVRFWVDRAAAAKTYGKEPNPALVDASTAGDVQPFLVPLDEGVPTCTFDSLECDHPASYRHAGIDYEPASCVDCSTVRAVASGTVVRVQTNGEDCDGGNAKGFGCRDHGLGNVVVIEHQLSAGPTIYSLYAHLASVDVTQERSCRVANDLVRLVVAGSGFRTAGLATYISRLYRTRFPGHTFVLCRLA